MPPPPTLAHLEGRAVLVRAQVDAPVKVHEAGHLAPRIGSQVQPAVVPKGRLQGGGWGGRAP